MRSPRPRIRALGPTAAGLLGCALVAAAAAPVRAQSSSSSSGVGGGSTGTTIVCQGGLTIAEPTRDFPRDSSQFPQYISHDDCVSNITESFAVTPPSTIDGTFQIWASADGTDCSFQADREASCTELTVESSTVPSSVGIQAQQLANLVTGGGCDLGVGSGAPQTTAIYFLIVPSDLSDATVFCTYSGNSVDLLGPIAPLNVRAGIADSALILDYSASTDSDVASYYAYCDDGTQGSVGVGVGGGGLGGAGSTGGGGVGGASATTGTSGAKRPARPARPGAGAGGFSSSSSTSSVGGFGGSTTIAPNPNCLSSVLAAGEIPNDMYRRGSPVTGTEVIATGLTNGVIYACGVAAIDAVGNPGPLSELACAPAEPTDDFFSIYLRDGGQAGCAFGGSGRALGAAAGMLGAALLALGARRRRKGRRS